jgi:hypothetical protein
MEIFIGNLASTASATSQRTLILDIKETHGKTTHIFRKFSISGLKYVHAGMKYYG